MQGHLLTDKHLREKARGSEQNSSIRKERERVRLEAPRLSPTGRFPKPGRDESCLPPSAAQGATAVGIKVERARALIILNDRLPGGCQLCAQKGRGSTFLGNVAVGAKYQLWLPHQGSWNTGLFHQKGGRKISSKDALPGAEASPMSHVRKVKQTVLAQRKRLYPKVVKRLGIKSSYHVYHA